MLFICGNWGIEVEVMGEGLFIGDNWLVFYLCFRVIWFLDWWSYSIGKNVKLVI